jgi:hypothetical protein
MKTKKLWMLPAILGWLAAASSGYALVLSGDPADYQTEFEQVQGSLGTVSSSGGSSETLQVFSQDTGGFLLEAGRPIFQFDLSSLSQPLASAVLKLRLLSAAANTDYAIEVWGAGNKFAEPLIAGTGGAAGQYAASGYLQAAPAPFLDQETAEGEVSADITDFLNARYDELAAGGDSWVFLRLQPSQDFIPGSGVNASFTFASADHIDEAFHPRIEVTPIPEPAHAVLLAGLAALFLIRRRLTARPGK